jgi:hypothetical protein
MEIDSGARMKTQDAAATSKTEQEATTVDETLRCCIINYQVSMLPNETCLLCSVGSVTFDYLHLHLFVLLVSSEIVMAILVVDVYCS